MLSCVIHMKKTTAMTSNVIILVTHDKRARTGAIRCNCDTIVSVLLILAFLLSLVRIGEDFEKGPALPFCACYK